MIWRLLQARLPRCHRRQELLPTLQTHHRSRNGTPSASQYASPQQQRFLCSGHMCDCSSRSNGYSKTVRSIPLAMQAKVLIRCRCMLSSMGMSQLELGIKQKTAVSKAKLSKSAGLPRRLLRHKHNSNVPPRRRARMGSHQARSPRSNPRKSPPTSLSLPPSPSSPPSFPSPSSN